MRSSKAEARDFYLQARRAIPKEIRVASDVRLTQTLSHFLDQMAPVGPILGYSPLASEANPFIKWPAHFVLPLVEGVDLKLLRPLGEHSLKRSKLGVLEPDPDASEEIAPHALKAAVVPGVAFDRRGKRLGLGKGFYDRFLKKLSPDIMRIGAAYSVQVSPENLPCDEWDESVEWIATEDFVLHVEGKGKRWK